MRIDVINAAASLVAPMIFRVTRKPIRTHYVTPFSAS